MLIGETEELEWADAPESPRRVRIRHRGANHQLFEVRVDARSVDLGNVAHSRQTRDGRVVVRLVPGRYVASLDHDVLVVRPHEKTPPPPALGAARGFALDWRPGRR